MILNDVKFEMMSFTKTGKQIIEINLPGKLLSNAKLNIFEFQPLDVISHTEIGCWKGDTLISIYVFSFQIIESK